MSFFISKFFTYIILSPGIFILILILISFLILREKRTLSLFFIVILIFFLYFLSIEPGMDFLLKGLEDSYPPLDLEKAKDADAIVILGGGLVEGRSPFEGETISLSQETLARVMYGYFLWKKFMIPVILSGGRPLMRVPGTSADEMRKFLLRLEVPDSFLIVEDRSRNTYENALYTLKICKDSDFKKIILVTSAFHLRRAVSLFSGKGIKVYPALSSYLTERHPYTWVSFFPHARYLYCSFVGLKEYVGMLFYKILPK